MHGKKAGHLTHNSSFASFRLKCLIKNLIKSVVYFCPGTRLYVSRIEAAGPHCGGEIWKRSLFWTVRPTAHTNLSRKTELYENALQGIWKQRLCVLLQTDIILNTELFENVLQNGGIWKRRSLSFSCGRKHFHLKTELYENDDRSIV